MHRSQQARGRSLDSLSRGSSSRGYRTALAGAIEVLESRRLLSGETATPIPAVLANTTTPSANSITLNQFFSDANLPGTLVTFKTNLGTITVALTDAATPLTVANFLSYVNSGAYTNTIFHREASFAANVSAGTPADIVQGGGYVVSGRTFKHIPTNAPVNDEYTTELFGDVAGTLAMAKTASANSATSEWYFNVNDNTSALDTPTTDSNGVTTSYTAFGKVITGMPVIDEIAHLPAYNVSSSLGLTDVPVTGLTPGEVTKKFPVSTSNLVFTQSVTSQPGVDYTVTSSDDSLVTPKVTNGVLSFTYATGKSGSALITVLAKNLDGSTASTSFTVTVPVATTPAAPTATDITAPNVVTGTTADINVLSGVSDSAAALNASSVAIVTQPTHGTATVNASTGAISYAPASGYLGSDSLTYTVADTTGAVSDPATVILDIVQAPVTVTIGTSSARSLTFTQPNGAVGHLSLSGGTAKVTFTTSFVTTSTSAGIVTATGAGASIASIVITDTGAAASLRLTATGAISIGSITDNGAVSLIDAPNLTLTGTSSFKSIQRLILAGTSAATLSLGDSPSTVLVLPNAVNTTVNDNGSFASITSTAWTNTDGGFYTVSAASIGRLIVTGTFADVLNLTFSGNALATSTVGQAAAAWTLTGAIGSASFGTPSASWSLATPASIGKLTFLGTLANNISAGSISSLSVAGATNDSSIATTSIGSSDFRFVGQVANSDITVTGNLLRLSAPSLNTANISGGVIGSVIVPGAVTTATISTMQTLKGNPVQIGLLKFGGALTGSTINAGGEIASLTAASLSSTTVDSGLIGSLVVAGTTTGATIQTNKTLTGKQAQIGTLRFGGAVTTSSVSTSGQVGSITAASLSGAQLVAGSISAVTVAGTTATTTITTDTGFSAKEIEIGKLTFGGAVTSSSVTSVGNVGHITAASLTGSHIYAGVSATTTSADALPTTTGDFTNNARIDSVTLGKAAAAFAGTIISADQLGTLQLGKVTSNNNAAAFGVAAATIDAITATLVPGGTINAGKPQLKSAATLAAYEQKAKVTLGDFNINLI